MANGGFVFPCTAEHFGYDTGNHSRGDLPYSQGMTLRDYFASQALIAINASSPRDGSWSEHVPLAMAKNAYQVADAMIKESQKS